MGAACCVAAKSKSLLDESNGATTRMSTRYSPLWNVRWDNRGRVGVAGEDTAIRWFADMSSRDSQLGNISETEVRTISEEVSPRNFLPREWRRSPLPEERVYVPDFRSPNSAADSFICRSISVEGKDATSLHVAPDRSPIIPSISSVEDQFLHANSTPGRLARHIPRNSLYIQTTDERMPGFRSQGIHGEKPSPIPPGWTNHSARVSHDGSSDSCSIPEYLANWSVDSDSLGVNNGDTITRSNSQHSSSSCSQVKACGACSKLLSDKSSFGSQKLMPTNELAVVAVLVCGHVYHAECLECMTLEDSKHDPACPVCTFGEQQTMKLSKKAIKVEMESRFKHSKRSRSRLVDSELESIRVCEVGKGVKIDSSSGMKSSFLKRHFSLGSKGNNQLSEGQSSKKKAFSWTRTRSTK